MYTYLYRERNRKKRVEDVVGLVEERGGEKGNNVCYENTLSEIVPSKERNTFLM